MPGKPEVLSFRTEGIVEIRKNHIPAPQRNLQEAATALRIANIQAKPCWSKHGTNMTQGLFSWHVHIKRWTRLIKRKITFSDSHYAATNFMAKLCENTFLRQSPAYADIDNLLVVVRDKYSECLPKKISCSIKGFSRPSNKKQPWWSWPWPGPQGLSIPWGQFPTVGLPRCGHLTLLNSNLLESLDSSLDSMSQLFSLRTISWKQMYIFSAISSLQQFDRVDLWLHWERRHPIRIKKCSGSSDLQWSWFYLNKIPEKD